MQSKVRKYGLIGSLIFLGWCLFGCSATRHLEPGQVLLRQTVRLESDVQLPAHAGQKAIRTQPNRRMLFPKTYLHIHSMALTLEKDTSRVKKQLLRYRKFRVPYARLVNWMRDDLGEKPVLIDLESIRKDSINLVNTYFAHGFFHPDVRYRIDTLSSRHNRNKANVHFSVSSRHPYVIDTVIYRFGDSLGVQDSLLRQIRQDYHPEAAYIRQGQRYNQNDLVRERARATEALRNEGYYTFSQSMISMEVDTFFRPERTVMPDSLGTAARPVRLYVHVREVPPKYRLREITAILRAASDPENLEETFVDDIRPGEISARDRERIPLRRLDDSLKVNFVVSSTLIEKVNYNFIAQRIHFAPDSVFAQDNARLTQQSLQSLGMFQYVVAKYTLLDSTREIDVAIDMRMSPNYQIKSGLETFTNDIATTANLPSVGANFAIRNKNALRRSELFELGVNGNVGFYGAQLEESQFARTFYQLGANVDMNFPTLLIPFFLKKDFSRLNPATVFSSKIRLESLREYDRTTTGLNLGYRWNHHPFRRNSISQLTPVSIDFISINIKDSLFQASVDGLPPILQRDYNSRFSARFAYSYTHSNYQTTRARATHLYRTQVEMGGNLPFLLNLISVADNDPRDNLLFGKLFFGQYLKASLEARYFVPLADKMELVFRGFAGGAHPYNFTPVVPYESRFFSGGTNSMRGWRSNTLGPGRASTDSINVSTTANSALLAPGGELALEFNAELRMDLISYLELAFFTDLGNVWFNQPVEGLGSESQKSHLTARNFRLGWDAGLGFRFDFSFLLLRFDVGQQLYAPDRGWVLNSVNDIGSRRTQFNIGIGYPF